MSILTTVGRSVPRVKLSHLLGASVDAAVRAGAVIREVSQSGNLATRNKCTLEKQQCLSPCGHLSFDPQTIADLGAQHLIVSKLHEEFGQRLCLVGEEDDPSPQAKALVDEVLQGKLSEMEGQGLDCSRLGHLESDLSDGLLMDRVAVWIDPLDATRAFTEGRLEYVTVLIGISYEGKPLAGVIHHPFARSNAESKSSMGGSEGTIVGAVGRGVVFGERAQGNERWIGADGGLFSKSRSRDDSVRVVHSRNGLPPALSITQTHTSSSSSSLSQMMPLSCRPLTGAGHKFAVLAGGGAEAVVMNKTSKWDTCAGQALIESLGGRVSDMTGDSLKYETPTTTTAAAPGSSPSSSSSSAPPHPSLVQSSMGDAVAEGAAFRNERGFLAATDPSVHEHLLERAFAGERQRGRGGVEGTSRVKTREGEARTHAASVIWTAGPVGLPVPVSVGPLQSNAGTVARSTWVEAARDVLLPAQIRSSRTAQAIRRATTENGAAFAASASL